MKAGKVDAWECGSCLTLFRGHRVATACCACSRCGGELSDPVVTRTCSKCWDKARRVKLEARIRDAGDSLATAVMQLERLDEHEARKDIPST